MILLNKLPLPAGPDLTPGFTETFENFLIPQTVTLPMSHIGFTRRSTFVEWCVINDARVAPERRGAYG
jgi:hypothetical protein